MATRSKREITLARPAAQVVRDLDAEIIEFDGKKVSKLEAYLRLTYMKALKGDVVASVELQRVRDRCAMDGMPEKVGVLVVPEPIGLEEWEQLAAAQQAQFRERRPGAEED